MADTFHEISKTLGELTAHVKNLLDESRHASEARKATYEKLENIQLQLNEAEKRFEELERRIAVIEKPVADFNKWRERAIGAVMLISLGAALIGGTVAAYWHKIVTLIKGW